MVVVCGPIITAREEEEEREDEREEASEAPLPPSSREPLSLLSPRSLSLPSPTERSVLIYASGLRGASLDLTNAHLTSIIRSIWNKWGGGERLSGYWLSVLVIPEELPLIKEHSHCTGLLHNR